MGGQRIPGVIGIEPQTIEGLKGEGHLPPGAGLATPGPTGIDSDLATPLAVSRIVKSVKKDWEPPAPTTTPAIIIKGNTLEEAADNLNKLQEWGQGGGMLRADPIPVGTSPEVNVSLHANLVLRMPNWTGYDKASAAAKAEWDRMTAKLKIHEERHVEIAIEEADSLANDLIGHEISEIAKMVTAANKTMKDRQDELDHDTEHGSKPKVKYGDVSLDTSII